MGYGAWVGCDSELHACGDDKTVLSDHRHRRETLSHSQPKLRIPFYFFYIFLDAVSAQCFAVFPFAIQRADKATPREGALWTEELDWSRVKKDTTGLAQLAIAPGTQRRQPS